MPYKKADRWTEQKKVLDRPSPKKVFHNALKMKNAAVLPTKNPSCKKVVNALDYTEQKAELKIKVFLQCFRGNSGPRFSLGLGLLLLFYFKILLLVLLFLSLLSPQTNKTQSTHH